MHSFHIRFYDQYMPKFQTLATLLLISALSLSCATSESTQTNSKGSSESSEQQSKTKERKTENLTTLDRYRSDLSDPYARRTHDMPEAFTWRPPEETDNEEEVNNEGYRIQIMSTRNVSVADSVTGKFRRWMAELRTDYQPNTYIIFRQPYYRVHVGDFKQREQAIDFSRLIKRRYPDAWVVHDRINPMEVPSDSALQRLLQRPFEIRDAVEQ
jgi:hypothetical protein